jgi:hypothetical protein
MAYQRDYNYGKSQELVVLPQLNDFFKDDIKPTPDRYTKYDFEGKEYIYEIKSRTNPFSKYPTTLFPTDKVVENKKQRFVFQFTDGLYYIEYDPIVFKDIEVASFRRFRIGVRDKEKPYFHIPTTLLKRIL